MNRQEQEIRRSIMSKISQKVNDRPLPPTYKFLIHQELHKRFTLKERILVAMGYALLIDLKIACLHNPGASAAKWECSITENSDPNEEVRAS